MAAPLFCVYLGIERDLAEAMPNTNYWCHPTYDPEAAYAESTPHAATYITSASVKDPESPDHAPEGCSTLELMTWVTPDPEAWGVAGTRPANGAYSKEQGYREAKDALTEAPDRRRRGSRGRVAPADPLARGGDASHPGATR